MTIVHVLAGPDAGLVWHHGSPVAEQRALEAGTGVVDWSPSPGVGRGVLTVTGPDRLTWLHSLTTQHLEGLGAGEPFTALVLSPTGHIEHVLHGVDDGGTVWAWTEPGRVADLVSWLDRMRFMTRVEVADRSDEVGLVWVGDGVDTPGDAKPLAIRRSPLGGRELFWPREAPLPEGVPVGVWAAEAIRIAAGQPRIGVDTDHRTIPNEIGLLGTHLDKGCYRGQETVARVHTLGRPPRRLVQLMLDGSVDALPEAGSPVRADGREVGFVGSSSRHHELGPIALALVKRNLPVEATVVVTGVGTDDQPGSDITAAQEPLVDPEVGLHVRPRLG
ncbi:CAF17-like 4Fe-4S cluster assembly/insertion protein YgfZ [Aestuariimicrobium sp. T2.26MG-19.2B]|uniref:CAF17-like 4Fe-4S cluster assembly/insertion protein YgfZ n=1 Tax=Aestuariimicrobium sp. T2.26MG-19.2B TaxID=3040679 RepID=UPI0024776549|nr:glycine cleavage T C-terminal barrel domain-containing protein [Aestuariimicrobium sp. T2.26MG-19.2B]CAI9405389.1 tRNA-modifying protein YgfZ [Aestuariimicrobium sp. T2.26MG-19.2B]